RRVLFRSGVAGEQSEYCRSEDYPTHAFSRLEWQANFAAGELTQPFEKVVWLLDGKEPPEIINLDLYAKNYQEYFGANRKMMETRLKSLGYILLNARYDWGRYC